MGIRSEREGRGKEWEEEKGRVGRKGKEGVGMGRKWIRNGKERGKEWEAMG